MTIYVIIMVLALIYLIPNVVGCIFYLIYIRNIRMFVSYEYSFVFFTTKLFGWIYKHISGITFGNFIFVKINEDNKDLQSVFANTNDRVEIVNDYYRLLIYHEMVHVRQQLIFGGLFFIIYFIMFVINYIKYRDYKLAYYYIPFERTARRISLIEDINYHKRSIFYLDRIAMSLRRRSNKVIMHLEKIKNITNKINKDKSIKK